jgi:hypothetical protein
MICKQDACKVGKHAHKIGDMYIPVVLVANTTTILIIQFIYRQQRRILIVTVYVHTKKGLITPSLLL